MAQLITTSTGLPVKTVPSDYVAPTGYEVVATDPDGELVTPKYESEAWVESALPAEIADALAAAKVSGYASIDSAEGRYRHDIFEGVVDGYRVYEYVVSLLESAAVNSIADYPQITGANKEVLSRKAAKRGTTEAAEAATANDHYTLFRAAIGDTAGIRVKHKDSVAAATDQAGIGAAVAAYTAEMDAYVASLAA
jgi:hypothetical protein